MDILTQTILGAAAAQTVAGRKHALGRWATVVGAVGGILADGDVLLTRLGDPALPWELHRHFTHSLAFIPVGAFIAAAPFMLFPMFRQKVWWTLLAALAAFATHGLLDSCTSYGTHLGWPFTNVRTAWDVISIIDPLFTLPLLLAVVWTVVAGRARGACIGLIWVSSYLLFAAVQHQRAMGAQRSIAQERGHEIVRGRVMPTLGNTVVWRSVYETMDGVLHADSVRTGLPLVGEVTIRAGSSQVVVRPNSVYLPPGVDDSMARDRLRRFSHFADGYLIVLPASGPGSITIGDARYSIDTGGFTPLWALRMESDSTMRWVGPSVDRRDAITILIGEIFSPGEVFRTITAPPSAR